jgi:hypothetical protein|nr:hypothetical protein [Kofleriaceae bacterium]
MLLFVVVAAFGCKQGLHDRCQIMDDCQSPLVCNTATKTCEETTGGGLDAMVPDGTVKLDSSVPLDGSGSGSGSGSDGSGSDGSGSGSGSGSN